MLSLEEFDAVARGNMDGIFRLALNYMGSYAEAEDVTQNVLIRLYRYRGDFENTEHLRRWLIRVTVNESKRALKSPWRKAEALDSLEYKAAGPEGEDRELIRSVMTLPEKYRVPMYLHYYEGYSTEEIAELLKLPGSTVRTRLRRGRLQLKAEFGGEENV